MSLAKLGKKRTAKEGDRQRRGDAQAGHDTEHYSWLAGDAFEQRAIARFQPPDVSRLPNRLRSAWQERERQSRSYGEGHHQ